MDHAAELWRRRQELRRAYEAAHGDDPAMWPTQHPGVVLGANAACLGCNWFHVGGRYRDDGTYEQHFHLARRHEVIQRDISWWGWQGAYCSALAQPSTGEHPSDSTPHRPDPAFAHS